MTVTIEIPKENHYGIDGECDYFECENNSSVLYHGLSVERDDEINVFIAEYCPHHEEFHAELANDMWYIGDVE